ncbi:MAG: hypothetical protein JWN46_2212, partial [Acidimicrobiales bacterium]|nr:hypothetical protein [Acidimicrobiales bacterium]
PARDTGAGPSAGGAKSGAGAGRGGARAEPSPVPTEGSWFRRVSSLPGGRAVLLSLVLTVIASIAVLFIPAKVAIERWDSKLKNHTIEQCVTPKGKAAKTSDGKNVPLSACAPLASRPADTAKGGSKDATRLQAVVKDSIIKFYGAAALALVVPPVLIVAAAVGFALKPGRRRAWNFAAIGFGIWMVLFGRLFGGPFFLIAFGALGYGVFKASRAEPRRPRPTRSRRGDAAVEATATEAEGDAPVADAGAGDEGVDVVEISGTEAEPERHDAAPEGDHPDEPGRNGRRP